MVATHNRASRLARLLATLRAQTLPSSEFEVIIVDDASADETRDVLARETAKGDLNLRAIHRPRSGGPSAARNDGWRAATAPLVAFTDDDCEVDPGWIAALLRRHERDPGAIVQGRTDPLPSDLHLRGPFSRTLEIRKLGPYFQACNILYPRATLEAVDGFDAETFVLVGEDTDLAWRAMESGAKAVFAEDARAYHAITPLGPLGYLRGAWRFADAVQLVPRHPGLRRTQLHHRVFWHGGHFALFRAVIALALGRHLPLLVRNWLRSPYIFNVAHRVRHRGGGPLMFGYWILYDVIEMLAMLHASVKYRTFVI